MRKPYFIMILLCCTQLSMFSQSDSLYTAIFITPTEDLIIVDADSLEVVDDPLLIDNAVDLFEYTFFISGIDTLSTAEIEINFSDTDSLDVSATHLLSEIDASEEMYRIGDSVYLPLGVYEYKETYSYTAITRDSNNNTLLTSSESYSEEE